MDIFFGNIGIVELGKETKKSKRMGKWEDITPDLLILIASRLHLFHDFLSFRLVCTSWRKVATKEIFSKKNCHELPLLMIAKKNDEKNSVVRHFYNLANEKVLSVPLLELHEKRCVETQGWLVSENWITGDVALFHPFSRVQLHLPPQFPSPSIYSIMIHKAVLSANPFDTQNYTLVVIYGNLHRPAFWKPGNRTWNHFITLSRLQFQDVIFYKEKFYASDFRGKVYELNFDVDGSGGVVKICATPRQLFNEKSVHYLVESNGSLLIVLGSPNQTGYIPMRFEVYEIDITRSVFERITDLGSIALFVGRSGCYSVDTCRFKTIKPNCIYCIDFTRYPLDMIVYNLTSEITEGYFKDRTFCFDSNPIWVTPSF